VLPGDRYANRLWADFLAAQPLNLRDRFLAQGYDHVGWLAKDRDCSLHGRGIGTALLKATIDWFSDQQGFDGLPAWACQPGSKKLLAEAGQMPHTVYGRLGSGEIKQVQDAFWNKTVTAEEYPDATEREPGLLRAMLLTRGWKSTYPERGAWLRGGTRNDAERQ
jgi:hypothetical protein